MMRRLLPTINHKITRIELGGGEDAPCPVSPDEKVGARPQKLTKAALSKYASASAGPSRSAVYILGQWWPFERQDGVIDDEMELVRQIALAVERVNGSVGAASRLEELSSILRAGPLDPQQRIDLGEPEGSRGFIARLQRLDGCRAPELSV